MIIVDSNGLIYSLTNNTPLPDEPLLVTEDLRDEYETAFLVNGHRELQLKDIIDLPSYSEVYFLKEYARYLSSFAGVDISSMRGIADVSILALVSCIVNEFGSSLQTQLDLGYNEEAKITVVTRDGPLSSRLRSDFGDKVEIKDPGLL